MTSRAREAFFKTVREGTVDQIHEHLNLSGQDKDVFNRGALYAVKRDDLDTVRVFTQSPRARLIEGWVLEKAASDSSVAVMLEVATAMTQAAFPPAFHAAAGRHRWEMAEAIVEVADFSQDERHDFLNDVVPRCPISLIHALLKEGSHPALENFISRAVDKGSMDMVEALLSHGEEKHVADAVSFFARDGQLHQAQTLISRCSPDLIHDAMMRRLKWRDGKISSGWHLMDALGSHMPWPVQQAWLAEHPGLLPLTEVSAQAHARRAKVGKLERPEGGATRIRPRP